jgi:DNA helicase-2/ATP-dependent DNA helicase PcrA
LDELLGELLVCGTGSKKVQAAYHSLLRDVGPELAILRTVPLAGLEGRGPAQLAEAIGRVRAGDVYRQAGYDGEYGVIRAFPPAGSERDAAPAPVCYAVPDAPQPPAEVQDAPAPIAVSAEPVAPARRREQQLELGF